jgi:hypothetical protein
MVYRCFGFEHLHEGVCTGIPTFILNGDTAGRVAAELYIFDSLTGGSYGT